jgi:uncharacterized protein YbjT (DUF2867 family)
LTRPLLNKRTHDSHYGWTKKWGAGQGIVGNALLPDLKLPMIATRDVGDYAAKRLLDLDSSGKQTRELLGERDLSMTEATAVKRFVDPCSVDAGGQPDGDA